MGIMNYIRLHVVIENIRIKQNNTAKRQEASDEIVNNVMITHNPRGAANRELGKAGEAGDGTKTSRRGLRDGAREETRPGKTGGISICRTKVSWHGRSGNTSPEYNRYCLS